MSWDEVVLAIFMSSPTPQDPHTCGIVCTSRIEARARALNLTLTRRSIQ